MAKDTATLAISTFVGALAAATASIYAPQSAVTQAVIVTIAIVGIYFLKKIGEAQGDLFRMLAGLCALASAGAIAYATLVDPLKVGSRVFICSSSGAAMNIRSAPNLDRGSKVLMTAPDGSEAIYRERSFRRYRLDVRNAAYFDYWRKVTYDGVDGWLLGPFVSQVPCRS